jgi:hypothetical protein
LDRRVGNLENAALLRRYQQAAANPMRMRALLDEVPYIY